MMNFNSHAHVERDATIITIYQCRQISTHTLTWSVTLVSAKIIEGHANFNSHAHVERDGYSGRQCR